MEDLLVRGEVNELMPGKDSQYIKVIGQLPIHLVRLALRTQIGGINEENYIRCALVPFKQFLVIAGSNAQPFEIVAT